MAFGSSNSDINISVGTDTSGLEAGMSQAAGIIDQAVKGVEKSFRDSVSHIEDMFDVLDDVFDDVEDEVEQLGNEIEKTSKKSANALRSIEDAASSLSVSFSAPLAAIAGIGIKLAAELELAEKSLTNMIGSAEGATNAINDLRVIASRGFDFNGLIQNQRKLQGFGFDAEGATATIEILGDAVAQLGGSDADLSGLVLAFGQIEAKGKVSAEEILQLAERGIPAYKILQQQLGLTSDQIANIGNAGISAREGIQAILEGLQQSSGGAAKGLADSLTGAFRTARSQIELALTGVGEDIAEAFNLQKVVQDLGNFVANVANAFQELDPSMQRLIITTTALAAAFPPLVLAGTQIVKLAQTLRTAYTAIAASATKANLALAPQVAIIAGIAAGIALLSLSLKSAYDAFPDSGFSRFIDRQITFIKQQYEEVVQLFSVDLPNVIKRALASTGFAAFSAQNPFIPVNVVKKTKEAAGDIKKTIEDAANSETAKKFGDAFRANLDQIGSYFTSLYDKITASSGNLTTSFEKEAKSLEDILKSLSGGDDTAITAQIGSIIKLQEEAEKLGKIRDATSGSDIEKITDLNLRIQDLQAEIKRLQELGTTEIAIDLSIKDDVLDEINRSLDDLVDLDLSGLEEQISKTVDANVLKNLNQEPFKKMTEDALRLSQTLEGEVVNAIGTVAEGLGRLATGSITGQEFFSSLIEQLAQSASTIGKLMIAMGVAQKVLLAGGLNPVAMIAAGAALVALGGLVKGALSNVTGGASGGGSSYGSGSGYQYQPAGQSQVVQVQGTISGNNIALSNARTNSLHDRLYGGTRG